MSQPHSPASRAVPVIPPRPSRLPTHSHTPSLSANSAYSIAPIITSSPPSSSSSASSASSSSSVLPSDNNHLNSSSSSLVREVSVSSAPPIKTASSSPHHNRSASSGGNIKFPTENPSPPSASELTPSSASSAASTSSSHSPQKALTFDRTPPSPLQSQQLSPGGGSSAYASTRSFASSSSSSAASRSAFLQQPAPLDMIEQDSPGHRDSLSVSTSSSSLSAMASADDLTETPALASSQHLLSENDGDASTASSLSGEIATPNTSQTESSVRLVQSAGMPTRRIREREARDSREQEKRRVYEDEQVSDSRVSGSDGNATEEEPIAWRVDIQSKVKLAPLLHFAETPLVNRFAHNFQPPIPSDTYVDPFISCAIHELRAPLRQLTKDEVPYTQERPKRLRYLDYEIDEHLKTRGTTSLSDLFIQPSDSSSSTDSSSSSPSSSSSDSSSPATLYASSRLGSASDLVDPAVFQVTLPDASSRVGAEQEGSVKEGFFWRSSPLYRFDPAASAELTIVKRRPVSFWHANVLKSTTCQLLLSIVSLKLSACNMEPFFCSLSLVDLKHEERLSEEFHFDLNDASLLTGHLKQEAARAEPLTLCKHAIFSLNERHRHEHTVLYLKIERVLAGEQSADVEYYTKSKVRTPFELTTISKKIRTNLTALSEYRQPFAWGLMPLFESSGEMRAPSPSSAASAAASSFSSMARNTNVYRLEKIWLQSEVLKERESQREFYALAKEALSDGGRKQKAFPSSFFEVRIDSIEDEASLPINRVDACYFPLKEEASNVALLNLAQYNVLTEESAYPNINTAPVVPSAPSASPASSIVTPASASSTSSVASSTLPATSSFSSNGPPNSSPTSASTNSFSSTPPPVSLAPSPTAASAAAAASAQIATPAVLTNSSASSASPSSFASSSVTQNLNAVALCREIFDFSRYSLQLPLTSFVSLLYVYPEWIKFEKFRNICCKIQVRSNDALVDVPNAPSSSSPSSQDTIPSLIMGKSSTKNFCASALTQVIYHRYSVTPQDEIKIMLPLNLSVTHHLFFTFYKVSWKNKPGSRELIGYSALPLFSRHRLLSSDLYDLSIASKLPKGYLSSLFGQSDKGMESEQHSNELHLRHHGSKTFSVRIRSYSSLFNSDESLSTFIQTFPNVKEVQAVGPEKTRDLCSKAIDCIPRCHPLLSIHYLPSLCAYFLSLIITRDSSFQSQLFAFVALNNFIQLVGEATNEEHRCTLLTSWIAYRMEELNSPSAPSSSPASSPSAAPALNSPTSPVLPAVPIYLALTRAWLMTLQCHSLINTSTANPKDIKAIFNSNAQLERTLVLYSWFHFECIVKSLGLSRTAAAAAASSSASSPASPFTTASTSFKPLTNAPPLPYETDLLSHLHSLMQIFVRLILSHRTIGLTVCKSLITNLAAFLLDLFYVLEKEHVVALISLVCVGLNEGEVSTPTAAAATPAASSAASVSSFSPSVPNPSLNRDPVLVEMKFAFHTILLDHPAYLDIMELRAFDCKPWLDRANALNKLPASSASSSPDALAASKHQIKEELLASIRSQYALSTLFQSDWIAHQCDREPVIKESVIHALRTFLTKIDHDARWRSAKPLIATMLFPLLDAILDNLHLLYIAGNATGNIASLSGYSAAKVNGGFESRLRRQLLSPLLFILHQTPAELLHLYFVVSAIERMDAFLTILHFCMEDFAYVGIKKRSEEPLEDKCILAPESLDVLAGNMGGKIATIGDYKSDLEVYMASIHKTARTQAGSRAKMANIVQHGAVHAGHPHHHLLNNNVPSTTAAASSSSLSSSVSSSLSSAAYSGQSSPLLSSSPSPGGLTALSSSIAVSSAASVPPSAASSSAAASDSNGEVRLSGGRSNNASTLPPPLLTGSSFKNSSAATSSPFSQPPPSSSSSSTFNLGLASSGGTSGGTLRQMRANLSSRSFSGGLSGTLKGGHKSALNTLSSSSSSASSTQQDICDQIVCFEGVLSRQVARIVALTLTRFFHAFSPSVLSACEPTFLTSLALLREFVARNLPSAFLVSFMPLLLYFVQTFGHTAHDSTARQTAFVLLAKSVFRACSFSHSALRKHGVSVIYQLLMNEYLIEQDLDHMQRQLTIALSELTDMLSLSNEACLAQSIEALLIMSEKVPLRAKTGQFKAQTGSTSSSTPSNSISLSSSSSSTSTSSASSSSLAPSNEAADFKEKMRTLLSRLSTILGDSMEISRQLALGVDADSAIIENLLCQVADAFSHLPEIRMAWLCRLAEHHEKQEQYAESGQCYLLVAQLAASLAHELYAKLQENNALTSSSSAISRSSQPLQNLDDNEKELVLIADRKVMGYYEQACQQLDKAECYEQCSDVYHMLFPLYHRHHEYKRLSAAHEHLHSIFERLITANAQQTRMLGTFYRVGYYGKKFGPRLDGVELIYKAPKITRLAEMATRVTRLYQKQLGCNVRILPDSNPVDRSKLDPEECVMQVTFVTPYFGQESDNSALISVSPTSLLLKSPDVALPDLHNLSTPSSGLLIYHEPRPRLTFIERHSFISHFKFSTPLTSTGKTFGSVIEQQKRNTVLSVKHSFPAILTAQVVIAKSERVLTPIESATDDITIRTTSLCELLNSPNIHAKSLTGILQGSVATQVNGGVREVCMGFLEPLKSEPTDAIALEQINNLRAALRAFLSACNRGIALNGRLSTSPTEQEFQRNLEAQFDELLVFKKFLHPISNGGPAAISAPATPTAKTRTVGFNV